MSQQKLRNLVGLFAICVLLSACATQSGCGAVSKPVTTAPEEPAVVEPTPPVVVQPVETPSHPSFETRSDGARVLVDNDGNPIRAFVRFALDESDISRGDFGVLQQHADSLVRSRDQVVLIEGHCDERGTREYNLGLGERRANAVRDFFLANGVRQSQIETVSFGEEKPLDTASNEAAWAKNRRVELAYR